MIRVRSKSPAAYRRSILAAIHVLAGPKHLGLDDDLYRDLVARVSGNHGKAVRSARDCDVRQLEAIAKELRRLTGGDTSSAQASRQWPERPKGELSPQMGKIEALLADAGRQWAYARAVAKRICKVDKLEWCTTDQLTKVIAAMQLDANRRAKRASDGR